LLFAYNHCKIEKQRLLLLICASAAGILKEYVSACHLAFAVIGK
jgi:hypothetical protein